MTEVAKEDEAEDRGDEGAVDQRGVERGVDGGRVDERTQGGGGGIAAGRRF
jgi:hypothetical protein